MSRNTAASKIDNGVILLLCQLRCHCNPDLNKFSSLSNTAVVVIFPNLSVYAQTWKVLKQPFSSQLNMKIIFYSHANNPLFYKRGFALSLVLKVRIFGTRKWPFDISSSIFLFISLLFFFFPLSFYMAHPSIMIPSVVGSRVKESYFSQDGFMNLGK